MLGVDRIAWLVTHCREKEISFCRKVHQTSRVESKFVRVFEG